MAGRSFLEKVRLTLIVLLWFMVVEVYCKRKKKSKGARVRHSRYKSEGQDYSMPLKVLGWLLMLIFAPVLSTFAYSVVKDPLTPQVARGAWDAVKERTTGYLSRNKEEHNE